VGVLRCASECKSAGNKAECFWFTVKLVERGRDDRFESCVCRQSWENFDFALFKALIHSVSQPFLSALWIPTETFHSWSQTRHRIHLLDTQMLVFIMHRRCRECCRSRESAMEGNSSQSLRFNPDFSGTFQVADALVNGLTVLTQTYETYETFGGVVTDLSGCRLSGGI